MIDYALKVRDNSEISARKVAAATGMSSTTANTILNLPQFTKELELQKKMSKVS